MYDPVVMAAFQSSHVQSSAHMLEQALSTIGSLAVLASNQARLGDLGACAGEFLALWVLVLNWKSCYMSVRKCVCIYMAVRV